MKLAHDDFHERIICTACGTQFDAPLIPVTPPVEHPHEHVESQDPLAELHEHIRSSAPAPTKERRSFRALWISLCALLLMGAIATAATMLWRMHPPGVVESLAARETIAAAPATQPTTQITPAATQSTTQPVHVAPAPPAALVPSPAPATQTVVAQSTDRFQPNPILLSLKPLAASPATRPTKDEVTDDRIGEAIKRGVDDLLIEFNKGALREDVESVRDNTHQGLRALGIYALLSASQAIRDDRIKVTGPFMKDAIPRMNNTMNASTAETMTYGRAIRATALAVYDRPEDRETLKRDLLWLVSANFNGAYTYGMPLSKTYRWGWDNSNSQFGLLGVWSAAETGLEVPLSYWAAVERHWLSNQLPDGTWGYAPRAPIGSLQMTAAGVASLFVTHDYLHVPKDTKMVVWPDLSAQLKNGLGWLEEDDHVVDLPNANTAYTLYAIERAGLASGFKYFGKHDWYRELAAQSLKLQREDGAWGDRSENLVPRSWGEVVETCFNLLFLSRGRHPVIMNKLRFDGASNNRPRDLSALSKFASRTLERPINWQIVNLKADWADWMDSPILYISSDRPPRFSAEDLEKLRNFALAGGMIFTNSDGGSPAFNAFVRSLVKSLFPQYELQDLPPDHPVYTVWKSPTDRPALQGVSNGSRLLLVHSPGDIAKFWQLRDFIGNPSAFEMGIDLFLYASGKGDLRNRLQSPWIADSYATTQGPVPIARLKYAGDWNPEPLAWLRFSRWMEWSAGISIDPRETPIASLDYRRTPLAVLTGRAKTDWTPDEIAAVRKFIQSGGHLLIDSCGGSVAFNDSATVLLHTACPDAKLLRIPRTDALFTAENGREDLTVPRVRAFVSETMGSLAGGFYGLKLGHGSAIITDLDITTGLLGTNTWGILGYRPEYATSLVKNWILYSSAQTIEEYAISRRGE
jgi:hypothetical protein